MRVIENHLVHRFPKNSNDRMQNQPISTLLKMIH